MAFWGESVHALLLLLLLLVLLLLLLAFISLCRCIVA